MVEIQVIDGSEYIDITDKQDGGVLKTVLRTGDGSEVPGLENKAYVYYRGTLLNNEEFDSCTNGNPFTFKVGTGGVIKAWDLCIATMTRNEKCKIICKPEYAYGKKGSSPKIGPNETLVFEIELLKWDENYITEDECVIKKTIKKGLQTGSPSPGSNVRLFFRGFIGEKMFHESEIVFNMCDNGYSVGIPLGLELALAKMGLHEKSVVSMSADYGYGPKGRPEWDVPPNSNISVEVYLEEFKTVKDSWDMSTKEKVAAAEHRKNIGNSFMTDNDLLNAQYFYKFAEEVVQNIWEEKEKALADPVISAIRMNLSLCNIKMQKFVKAIEYTDKVLEKEPKNVKALFRKGQAYLSLEKFNNAFEAFEKVLELDPTNSAAKTQRRFCLKGIKESEAEESKIYQNAFKKMASAHTDSRD